MSQQTLKVNSNAEPYADLPSICAQLLEAKAKKGVTFDAIGKAIGHDEAWVAALFYGQAKATNEELAKLGDFLDIPSSSLVAEIGENWFPRRGLGPIPPQDPLLYRLFEGVLVYGTPIKALIHEKFGDGIMSMIDCKVKVDRKPDPKGDRVVLTFDGKFLPYLRW
ncbi:Cyanase [Dichomitus squalens]|uniref:Cyanate hydratase n=1 Tax=Dichomitus squalens TaxID=114155 RepID=A0A4Q9NY83_9APHY|nr:Cyanase [Dichomitus squalens]TBU63016.1 Cyanase [Dichomitus squalens]